MLLSTRDEGGDDERARSASSESSATQPAGRIAYLSGPVLSASVYVVDVAGGEPEKVLDTGAETLRPDWSPDGRALVFSNATDGDLDVYVFDVESESLRTVTHTDADELAPDWDPTGQELVFTSDRDGSFDVYAVNASDGSDERQLTDMNAFNTAPDWHPTGRFIVFASSLPGTLDIWRMDADGKRLHNLTRRPGNEKAPEWSPDGNWIDPPIRSSAGRRCF